MAVHNYVLKGIDVCLKSFVNPKVITEMTKFRPCIDPGGKLHLGRRSAVQVGSKCDQEKIPSAKERKIKVLT